MTQDAIEIMDGYHLIFNDEQFYTLIRHANRFMELPTEYPQVMHISRLHESNFTEVLSVAEFKAVLDHANAELCKVIEPGMIQARSRGLL